VLSPTTHSVFRRRESWHVRILGRMRRASAAKPVGSSCAWASDVTFFLAICKEMVETGIAPDLITGDGLAQASFEATGLRPTLAQSTQKLAGSFRR